jgi:hypothetical protein
MVGDRGVEAPREPADDALVADVGPREPARDHAADVRGRVDERGRRTALDGRDRGRDAARGRPIDAHIAQRSAATTSSP